MKPILPDPVKLFFGILYSDDERLRRAKELLREKYGRIDYESEPFEFIITDYYAPEMGSTISRLFLSHELLIQPDEIARIKLESNEIEDLLALAGKRKVNLDPGYIDTCKAILASAKYNGPKVYLGHGIYADLTLYYEKGTFYPYPWSFPDFKTSQYNHSFLRIRELYKVQLKKERRGGKT
ncbi:MAG: DUF4416 family protein [Gemmatimonadota bacterium]|nr:MAG: DUF4416 family protein [Gemmatimonadota bacterium]